MAPMRELKTTQKMRHEKVILAIVAVALAAAVWLIMLMGHAKEQAVGSKAP